LEENKYHEEKYGSSIEFWYGSHQRANMLKIIVMSAHQNAGHNYATTTTNESLKTV
jgi:hypothetical protein